MTDWLISKIPVVAIASGTVLGGLILALTDDIGAIEKFLATFGVLAALVWFMWHNQTKVIPSLHENHRQDVSQICREHKESTERICTAFAETTERIEQQHSNQLNGTCQWRDKDS